MRNAKNTQRDRNHAAPTATLARTVAPEDVQTGDYVTLLHVTFEVPSFLWCMDAASLPADEPVRIQFLAPKSGVPCKVKAVCLPFVLVKYPTGQHRTLDLRQCRLARLDKSFARAAWRARKPSSRKRKKN